MNDTTLPALEQAINFIDNRLSPIPIKYRDKVPHSVLLERTTGSPSWAQWAEEPPPRSLVEEWFRFPAVNIGLIIPAYMGVIDFDVKEHYESWDTGHKFPTVLTARGAHAYFINEDIESNKKLTIDGRVIGDIKTHGYMIAPPSIHQSGSQYRWFNGSNITKAPIVKNLAALMPQYEIVGNVMARAPKLKDAKELPDLDPFYPLTHSIGDYVEVVSQSHDRKYSHARCPFHDDKNASFWFVNGTEVWGCWTCGYHGLAPLTFFQLAKSMSS